MAGLHALAHGQPCGATGPARILGQFRQQDYSEKRHEPAGELTRHQDRQIGSRTGQPGGVAGPRRSRRLLPPGGDVRLHRDDRQPHLVRVPGTKDQFLLNPYGMLYEEIDASSLIKIDVDGNVLFNATDYGVNKAGFVIHSAVHMARHDAPASRTRTRRRAWRSRRWNAGCCRWRRPRCASCTSPITTSKASPTIVDERERLVRISAITKR